MSREKLRWKQVGEEGLSSLAEGQLMRVPVEDQTLCFVRHKGKLHAMLDRCPHQGSSFVGGWCEGGFLICPRHRMGFDLETGIGRNGADRVQVFPVEEGPEGIYVGLPARGRGLFGLWAG